MLIQIYWINPVCIKYKICHVKSLNVTKAENAWESSQQQFTSSSPTVEIQTFELYVLHVFYASYTTAL